jgi:DNA-binding CsgD family transcriptional regulator
MQNRIPGGLIENNTEFFTAVINNELQPACNHAGVTYSFNDTPSAIKAIVYHDMKSRPEIEKGVESMVGSDEVEKLKKYIMCRYGALNTEADIDSEGNISEPEYVPCSLRGNCPYEGLVCCTIKIGSVVLSKCETSVFRLVMLPDKLIADKLFLSVETVKKHFQNIRLKTGLNNKIEMAIWATQKGII